MIQLYSAFIGGLSGALVGLAITGDGAGPLMGMVIGFVLGLMLPGGIKMRNDGDATNDDFFSELEKRGAKSVKVTPDGIIIKKGTTFNTSSTAFTTSTVPGYVPGGFTTEEAAKAFKILSGAIQGGDPRSELAMQENFGVDGMRTSSEWEDVAVVEKGTISHYSSRSGTKVKDFTIDVSTGKMIWESEARKKEQKETKKRERKRLTRIEQIEKYGRAIDI